MNTSILTWLKCVFFFFSSMKEPFLIVNHNYKILPINTAMHISEKNIHINKFLDSLFCFDCLWQIINNNIFWMQTTLSADIVLIDTYYLVWRSTYYWYTTIRSYIIMEARIIIRMWIWTEPWNLGTLDSCDLGTKGP